MATPTSARGELGFKTAETARVDGVADFANHLDGRALKENRVDVELLEVRGRRRDDVVDEPFGLDELGREGHDGRSLLSVAVARGPVRIELGRNAPPVDERHLGAPAIHLERGLFDLAGSLPPWPLMTAKRLAPCL